MSNGRFELVLVSGKTCSDCGGECCKGMPGEVFPADLGTTEDEITDGALALLASGRYALDCWDRVYDGEPWEQDDVYYLRLLSRGTKARPLTGPMAGNARS
jgi:hypothetical protein